MIVAIMVLTGPFSAVAEAEEVQTKVPTRLPGPAENFGTKTGMEDIAPLVELNQPVPGALVGPELDATVVFAAFKANSPGETSVLAFNGKAVRGKNEGDVLAVRLYVFASFDEKVAPVGLEWRNTPQAKQGEHTFEAVSLTPFSTGATVIVCAVAYQGDPNAGIGRATHALP